MGRRSKKVEEFYVMAGNGKSFKSMPEACLWMYDQVTKNPELKRRGLRIVKGVFF